MQLNDGPGFSIRVQVGIVIADLYGFIYLIISDITVPAHNFELKVFIDFFVA